MRLRNPNSRDKDYSEAEITRVRDETRLEQERHGQRDDHEGSQKRGTETMRKSKRDWREGERDRQRTKVRWRETVIDIDTD